MIIYFGLALDETAYPQLETTTGGVQYLGPQKLLLLLEAHLGLSVNPVNNDYLRIEQYRQSLLKHLEQDGQAFYAASLNADPFATATELLHRRDDLLLAGWRFTEKSDLPTRLKTLAAVEAVFRGDKNFELSLGFADRIVAVLDVLIHKKTPIQQLNLSEPIELLPLYFQKIVQLLKDQGVVVQILHPNSNYSAETDLDRFKLALNAAPSKQKQQIQGDGSLLVLKGKRENILASYLAALLKKNPGFRPTFLIPDKSNTLDNALLLEGLPNMGILSASLARPSLQVLKLVPVFLWNPINPYKILEFASLSVKPLHNELASRIAIQMAQTPGIKGEGWHRTVNRFFDELKERAAKDASINEAEIKNQYNFWFNRIRYDISKTVPKSDVIEIYQYLNQWAFKAFEDNGNKNHSLLVLSSQAQRIKELLERLPETQLTNLQLERIVRTIYEPAPVELYTKSVDCLPFIHQPNALIGGVDTFIWWNFIQNEQDHFFSRWYKKELDYLQKQGIQLDGPEQQNALLIWQRKRPILYTQKQLILVIPESINGSEAHPHTLFGDIEANFESLDKITITIDETKDQSLLNTWFSLPNWVALKKRQLGTPKPIINIQNAKNLEERDYETLSSLESLFYYPYQWVFRYKIKLQQSSILSVVKDNTLMGNLAHRFFEKLLDKNDINKWNRKQLDQWFDKEATSLLNREGATLMLYGREPERIGFLQRVKYAAWSMINLIRNNNWEIEATEKSLEGHFLHIPLNARADLVLKRGEERAIIDLKWRGASRRERIIRNEEDLQLVLYAKLLGDPEQWAHTAYFIMENGKMIARNNLAFKEIIAVSPDAAHEEVNNSILKLMEATYQWRINQLKNGKVEIRCQQTQNALEEHYGAELLDLLEMKSNDAPFDDYRTLINLIN